METSQAFSPLTPPFGLDVPVRILWLAALPLSVVFLGDFLLDNASSRFEGSSPPAQCECPKVSPCPKVSAAFALGEAAGRLWFLGSLFAIVALSLGAFAFAFRDTRRSTTCDSFVRVMQAFAIALAVFAIVSLTGRWTGFARPSTDILGPLTIAVAEKCVAILGGPIFKALGTEALMHVATPALALAAAAIVLSTLSCAGSPPAGVDRVANWKMQNRRVQRNLKIGAAVLVTGIIFHICWTSWPEFIFIDEGSDSKSLKSYRALVGAFAAYKAGQYSIFLASFYIPAMLLMHRNADLIAQAKAETEAPHPTPVDIYERRVELGLVETWEDLFKSLASILAPMATGVVGTLIQAVAK